MGERLNKATQRSCGSFSVVTMAVFSVAALLVTMLPNAPRVRGANSDEPFTPDKGKFKILVNGSEIGTEDFELALDGMDWVARGDAVVKGDSPGAGDMRSSGELRLSADGTPLRYEWTAQTDKKVTGSVEFEKGSAKTKTNIPGKNPLMQDFHFESSRIAVLDNNLYDQWAILARLYDWNTKGPQMFPVVIPQDGTPGMIKVEAQDVSDGMDALRVSTADLAADLKFDAKHHLVRLEVPAAKIVISR